MYIAASVFINDDERGLHHDYKVRREGLAPHAPTSQYQHNHTGEACPEQSEGTMPMRIESATQLAVLRVMGPKVVVAVTNGRLDFGTWKRIFYGEFDDRRRERVLVKIIGE